MRRWPVCAPPGCPLPPPLRPPLQIRVYCRVRSHVTPSLRCLQDMTSVAINVDGKEHTFGYDRVFGPGVGQEEVFSTVSELVQSALDGYHVCLFSYGQTGAGKTYTMQGVDTPEGRGIIPRAVEKVGSRGGPADSPKGTCRLKLP